MDDKKTRRAARRHRLKVCNWVLGHIHKSRRTIKEALQAYGYEGEDLRRWVRYVTRWIREGRIVRRCIACRTWSYPYDLREHAGECFFCASLPLEIGEG
jgi:hypothetical protein